MGQVMPNGLRNNKFGFEFMWQSQKLNMDMNCFVASTN
jgi:hypothetical protein